MISVVITTFNYGHFIEKAIKSLIAQTYSDWELIIVDDASTDDTEKVVHKFSNHHIRYFKNLINRGTYHSRDIGLKKAAGKWVCFLDADDIFPPDSLKLRMELLGKQSCNATHTALIRDELGIFNTILPVRVEREQSLLRFINDSSKPSGVGINLITTLADINIYKEIGEFGELNNYFPHNDYAYFLKMTQIAKFTTSDQSSYIYRIHENSHSTNHATSILSGKRYQTLLDDFKNLVGVFSKN